jgi:hypothetical protein
MSAADANDNPRIQKFLVPAPRDVQQRAVDRELKRLRPKFRFSDAELRRLRQSRRKRVG